MTDPKYMRPGLDFAVGKAVEELGELQSAIGKTMRWGWLSANPELPLDEQESNVLWVRREIADVRGALDNLERELDQNINDIDGAPRCPKITDGDATYRVGRWLSAALDDPQVCDEMKADILAWMEAGKPNVQPVAI